MTKKELVKSIREQAGILDLGLDDDLADQLSYGEAVRIAKVLYSYSTMDTREFLWNLYRLIDEITLEKTRLEKMRMEK